MFVVDAPPLIVKSPLVIVDEAFERNPFVKVVRPVYAVVPVIVRFPLTERFAPFRSERSPFWLTVRAVVVAKSEVDVEMAKMFVLPPARPAIEREAKGDEVPMPRRPVEVE